MTERERFEAWWYASKYCQVALDNAEHRQTAWDGWQAAIERLSAPAPVSERQAELPSTSEPQTEPVAWMWEDVSRNGTTFYSVTLDKGLVPEYVTDKGMTPLYAHPAATAPAVVDDKWDAIVRKAYEDAPAPDASTVKEKK